MDSIARLQGSNVVGILEQLHQCSSDGAHKDLIDSVLKKFLSNPDFVRNNLIEFFIETNPKRSLSKYMFEKLNSLQVNSQSVFEAIMDSVLKEKCDIIFKKQILGFLASYSKHLGNQKFAPYLDKVFPFYLEIIETFSKELRDNLENEDFCVILSMTYHQLSTILPKVKNFNNSCLKMVVMTYEILERYEKLKLELISKSVMVLAHFLLQLPQNEINALKHKEHPMLEFLDKKNVILKSKTLRNLFKDVPMQIVLNITLYSTSSHILHIKFAPNKTLLDQLFENLLELALKTTSFANQILQISRTLDTMSKFLIKLENFDRIFTKSLTFAWSHLDHFMEQVVNCTRSFFKNLTQQAFEHYKKGNQQYLTRLFTDLNSIPIFSKVRLNALAPMTQILGCDLILEKCPQVRSQLLTLASSSSDHDLAGQVYTNLMMYHLKKNDIEEAVKLWLRPILLILTLQNSIKFSYVLEGIITNAFKVNPKVLRHLFAAKKIPGSASECVVILKCIHYARMHSITLMEKDDSYWRGLILKSTMEMMMVHQNEEVRINVLRVISECQKTTEEFTEWEFNSLFYFLEHNVGTQSAAMRSKMCTYYKKILKRVQHTFCIRLKQFTILEEEWVQSNRQEVLSQMEFCANIWEYYSNFLDQFMQKLVFYISPDSNHSRRALCLELLIYQKTFTSSKIWLAPFKNDAVRSLHHILSDSYESNKQMAVDLLAALPPSIVGFKTRQDTLDYYEICMTVACDVRPSRSITASYMFQVLLQSPHSLMTRDSIGQALTNPNLCFIVVGIAIKVETLFDWSGKTELTQATPIYGLLLSCRKLLHCRNTTHDNKAYAEIFRMLVDLCLKLKCHLLPIVANDSPEGYLPYELEFECDYSSKSQRLLVYSWKTMKEIMLLLAEIVHQVVVLEPEMPMLKLEKLLEIGDFFMEVFVTTKHRGVFEQAHIAFSLVCKSFENSTNSMLLKLPNKYLNDGIALCTGLKSNTELCPTRRSAGLPFLILSALTPKQVDCVNSLIATCIDSSVIHRMHCLNVLRFVIKNSKLSEAVACFIDRAAIVALEGYKSKTWGIRNSATLLLSAIIIRMFGVAVEQDEKKLTLDVFHMRYIKLFHYLLQNVENGDSLYPVLLILAKLFPSTNEEVNDKVLKYVPFINSYMNNPSYKIRNLAARASMTLISEKKFMKQLEINFGLLAKRLGNNECHGLLLQIAHILHSINIDQLPVLSYLQQTLFILEEKHYSHLCLTLYINVIYIILLKCREFNDVTILKKILSLLMRQETVLSTCRNSYKFSKFQLVLLILLNKFPHVEATYRIITKLVLRGMMDKEIQRNCFHFLIYLNQQTDREHPLIVSGDIEISSQIKSLIHALELQTKRHLLLYLHRHLVAYFHKFFAKFNELNEMFLLHLLLLRHFPCFLKENQMVEYFLAIETENEEVICAIITIFDVILTSITLDQFTSLPWPKIIRFLIKSAAPSAADYRRLAVAQLLKNTNFCILQKHLAENLKYNILNMIMVLLEDDEEIIRNTISLLSKLTPYSTIANHARFFILLFCGSHFGSEYMIGAILSWGLRSLPEVSRDVSEVYERGELNVFAENIPVTHATCKMFTANLWNVSDGINNDLKEKTFQITETLLNCLVKVQSPMVDPKTKKVVISIFRKIRKFTQQEFTDFKQNFKRFFHKKILGILRNNLVNDYSTTKSFFTYVYNPVLEVHYKFPE